MVMTQQKFSDSCGVAMVGSENERGAGSVGSGNAGNGTHGMGTPHEKESDEIQVVPLVTAVLTAAVAELDATAAVGLGSTGGI